MSLVHGASRTRSLLPVALLSTVPTIGVLRSSSMQRTRSSRRVACSATTTRAHSTCGRNASASSAPSTGGRSNTMMRSGYRPSQVRDQRAALRARQRLGGMLERPARRQHHQPLEALRMIEALRDLRVAAQHIVDAVARLDAEHPGDRGALADRSRRAARCDGGRCARLMARLMAVVVLPSSAPGLRMAIERQPFSSMRCITWVRSMRNAAAAGSRLDGMDDAIGLEDAGVRLEDLRFRVDDVRRAAPPACAESARRQAGSRCGIRGSG